MAAAPKSTGDDVQRGVERFLQVNLTYLNHIPKCSIQPADRGVQCYPPLAGML